jgi:hypothetical protein
MSSNANLTNININTSKKNRKKTSVKSQVATPVKTPPPSPPGKTPPVTPPGKTPPVTPPGKTPQAARTSPQAARTSPQAARTSPQAARTSPPKQISPKLINTTIKSISKAVKDNLNKEISKDQCIYLVEQLKKINKRNINMQNPPVVKNPITNRDVKFNGDTTLGLLSNCYTKYKNDIPDLLDIIDEHNLIISNATKRAATNAVVVTKPKTSVSSKNIDNIINPSLLEEYKQSCKNLESKTSFTFEEYKTHMMILFKILNEIYLNTGTTDITFNLFDENTYTNYVREVEKFDINKIYNMTLSKKKNKLFDDNLYKYDDIGVIYNSIVKRIVVLNIIDNGNSPIFIFNYNHDHFSLNDVFEFKKYMSILPKYHCINNIVFKGTQQNDLILKVCKLLNSYTENFQSDYQILTENSLKNKNWLNDIKSYSDLDANNKLLCMLVNNNHFKKTSINDYYYYYNYNGPLPYMSTLDVFEFIKRLKEYQPYIMSAMIINEIEKAYKGVATTFFSRPVNEAIRNYLSNKLPINDKNILSRINDCFKFINYSLNSSYDKPDIYLFHGTSNKFHKTGDTEVQVLSFLSCSFNIYISIDYATQNTNRFTSRYDTSGVIYIFKIDKNIEYINFNDGLYQIILLPGQVIKIKQEINIAKITYVFCEIVNNPDRDFIRKLKDSLNNSVSVINTMYNIKDYYIVKAKYDSPRCILVRSIATTRILFRSSVPNIYTVDIGRNTYIYNSLGKTLNNSDINTIFNIQYTIHQHIINECYMFFKASCIKYNILYAGTDIANHIYTVWEKNDDYETAYSNFEYNLNNIMIDCLLANAGCHISTHYLVNKITKAPLLVWLKGSGMYTINGGVKSTANTKDVTSSYISILNSINLSTSKKNEIINDHSILDNIINDFNLHNNVFVSHLQKLKNEYIDFTANSLAFPSTSKEFKDIEKMINDLMDILIHRSKYMKDNMSTIKTNILRHLSPNQLGGLQPVLLKEDYKPKSKSKSRSRSPIQDTYELVKNNSLPNETIVNVNDLKEPYKTHYKDASYNGMVDISNEAFCVSTETYQEIKKQFNL